MSNINRKGKIQWHLVNKDDLQNIITSHLIKAVFESKISQSICLIIGWKSLFSNFMIMTRIGSALMIDQFVKKNGVNSDSLTHPPSNCYDLTWRKKVLLTKNSRLLWRQVVAKYLCCFLFMWSAVSILTQKWFSKVTFSPYIFFLVFTGFAPL